MDPVGSSLDCGTWLGHCRAERWAVRALVASEFKALRSCSSSCIVSQVLGTAEGKEGLLRSLQSAARRDLVLVVLAMHAAKNDGHDAKQGRSNNGVAAALGVAHGR